MTAFFPVAVMMLLGICCLWKYRRTEWNYVFFFLAAVFLIAVFWRIPVIITRRYMVVVVVPGLLFAVLFLKTLIDVSPCVGRWFCGFLLVAIAIAGTGKALRMQEPKPYLTEIPTLIKEDMQKHQWENAYVILLGNLGGHFEFSQAITVSQLNDKFKFNSLDDNEEIFSSIDALKLENFQLHYPVIYVCMVSNGAGEIFSSSWEKRYGNPLTLFYEFIRSKGKKRYQVFRLVSPFESAQIPRTKRFDIYKKFNLLPNPDFSQKKELLSGSSEWNKLRQYGVEVGDLNGCFYVPKSWRFMTEWKNDAAFAGIKYTEQGKLRLSCKQSIYFLQGHQPFGGEKKYQVGGMIKVKQPVYFLLDVRLAKNKKFITARKVINIPLQSGRYELCGVVDLSDWQGEGYIAFGMNRGDIEFESFYLVEQSVFSDSATQGKK